jgi:transposase
MTAHTKAGSLYYTNDWHAYTFIDIHGNHVVINKEKGKPKGRNQINGVEGFWSYAKHWLYHYWGVPKKHFHLYLKEIEWRSNHRNEGLVHILRNYLNQRVVKELI